MRRWIPVLTVLILATTLLVLGAAAAEARQILGCDGIVQWPCPGPVL